MIPYEIEDTIIARLNGQTIVGTILGIEEDTGIDDNVWLDVIIWDSTPDKQQVPFTSASMVSVDPKNIIMNQTLKLRELLEL